MDRNKGKERASLSYAPYQHRSFWQFFHTSSGDEFGRPVQLTVYGTSWCRRLLFFHVDHFAVCLFRQLFLYFSSVTAQLVHLKSAPAALLQGVNTWKQLQFSMKEKSTITSRQWYSSLKTTESPLSIAVYVSLLLFPNSAAILFKSESSVNGLS